MYRKVRFQRLSALFVGTKKDAVQNFDFKNVIFGNFFKRRGGGMFGGNHKGAFCQKFENHAL
jgi:hypothetical protein